jgi:hypothetical protein
MKNIIAAGVIGVGALFAVALPATAQAAGPQDDVLCSSNMAYRTTHAAACAEIGINSHGGGGGPHDTSGASTT